LNGPGASAQKKSRDGLQSVRDRGDPVSVMTVS
jgi:hypothetical protein